MPLYEYRCEACGAKEERLQSYTAPTVHDCQECGRPGAMHREISRTAFVLAGSGWYAGGYAGNAPAPSRGAGASAGSPESHGDGKPAKKAPAAETGTEPPAGSMPPCASGCACHSPKIEATTKPD